MYITYIYRREMEQLCPEHGAHTAVHTAVKMWKGLSDNRVTHRTVKTLWQGIPPAESVRLSTTCMRYCTVSSLSIIESKTLDDPMSLSICGRILTRSFLRKRRDVCHAEVDSSRLERTYTLFDLLCVGIGITCCRHLPASWVDDNRKTISLRQWKKESLCQKLPSLCRRYCRQRSICSDWLNRSWVHWTWCGHIMVDCWLWMLFFSDELCWAIMSYT